MPSSLRSSEAFESNNSEEVLSKRLQSTAGLESRISTPTPGVPASSQPTGLRASTLSPLAPTSGATCENPKQTANTCEYHIHI